MPTPPRLPLTVLPQHLAVCRFPPGAPAPVWATESLAFSCITRTLDELSVLAEERLVPEGVPAERGYRALKVRGPLPFHLVGIFASLAGPLAGAGISIFALSTFDTDYVLVKEADLPRAIDVLREAGHEVRSDDA
jgi:hypothetical protein